MRFSYLVVLPVLAVASRCGAGERTAESAPPPAINRMDARFALVPEDSITLERSQAAGLAGFDLDRTGAVALGDSAQGTVQVYAPDGSLRLSLGGKGLGPGEFTDPRFPRFRGDGTLHVVDAANARVAVYNRDGELLRCVQLRPLTSLSGFIPLEDGRYLVTSDDPDGYVLFLFDSEGEVLDRLLPIRRRLPAVSTSPSSKVADQFWLAQRGDSAFVISTLSDSLWVVRLSDRRASAVAIDLRGHSRHSLANDADSLDRIPRQETGEVAVAIEAGSAGLVLNFIDRIGGDDERRMAVVLTPTGHWVALQFAPRLLHSGSGGLVTVSRAADGTERLMLRRFRLMAP